MKISRKIPGQPKAPAKREEGTAQSCSPYSLKAISQTATEAATIRTKPQKPQASPSEDPCQELSDEIKRDHLSPPLPASFRGNPKVRQLRSLFLTLCRAVQNKQVAVIPGLMKKIVVLEAKLKKYYRLRPWNLHMLISEDVSRDIYGKLALMGLGKEGEGLLGMYLRENVPKIDLRGQEYEKKLLFYNDLTDRILKLPFSLANVQSGRNQPMISHGFQTLLKGMTLVSYGQYQNAYITVRDDPANLLISSYRNQKDFYEGMTVNINKVFSFAQVSFQRSLDAMRTQISGGVNQMPPAWNNLEKGIKLMFRSLAWLTKKTGLNVGAKKGDNTKSQLLGDKPHHKDYFTPGDTTRELRFSYYDKSPKSKKEGKINWKEVLNSRMKQLQLLKMIFTGAGNKAAIAQIQGGKFQLGNVDHWQQFVWSRFKALRKKKGDIKALEMAVDLLSKYMEAYTVSTPHNVLDTLTSPKNNYLNRKFPRGLAGQLIHDCGVYALRIAYILSKLGRELGLRIRYVIMPFHVGLVISLKNRPVFIVHNSNFYPISKNYAKGLLEDWKKGAQDSKKNKGKVDPEQFLGELASVHFIAPLQNTDKNILNQVGGGEFARGNNLKKLKRDSAFTNIPFRFNEALPNPSSSSKNAKGTQTSLSKKSMWQQYLRMNLKPLFHPGLSDDARYALRIGLLNYQKACFAFHNKIALPFWNQSMYQLWKKHRGPLRPYMVNIDKAKKGLPQAQWFLPKNLDENIKIEEAVKAFSLAMFTEFKNKVLPGITTLSKQGKALNQKYAQKGVLAPGTRLGMMSNFVHFFTEGWIKEVQKYNYVTTQQVGETMVEPVRTRNQSDEPKKGPNDWKLKAMPPCFDFQLEPHVE